MIVIIILWKSDLNSFALPLHVHWRIYWYYFHTMFSFSCRIGNIFEPYGILILWMLLDYQMSQLTVLDRNQIMRICKIGKKIKNILVLWCTSNSIFIFPSISGETAHIQHPVYWSLLLGLFKALPAHLRTLVSQEDHILPWAYTSCSHFYIIHWSICSIWVLSK